MFLDNKRKGNVGDTLKSYLKSNSKLSIITSYFTIYGFAELSKELKKIDSVSLLLTHPQIGNNLNLIYGETEENRYKNLLNQKYIARECYEWLTQKASIRQLNPKANVNFSAYNIQNKDNQNISIQGNSNFSTTGLGYTTTNSLFMNQATTEYQYTKELLASFNEIWENKSLTTDIKSEILKNLEKLFANNSAELIYFMTLYNIFKDFIGELDEENIIKTKTGFKETIVWNKLYNFQKDGVLGAIEKLEKYNGCIIADSVGLGKTFEALAVIKYYELRNDRVLVLCPKKLRDNWTVYTINDKRNLLSNDRFNYDVLNHTDLTRLKGQSGEINLATLNWENYDLIVIDESHNFRNTSTNKNKRKSRYDRLLEDVLKKGVKTKVLMLSATPVNNRLNDLKNQVYLITEAKDTALSEFGINSIERTLRFAQNKFNKWLELSETERTTANLLNTLNFDYFKLLDLMTIARSRKHIQKYYDTADIGEFPNRLRPLNIKPDIDIEDTFPPLSEINKTIRKLNLCAYSPLKYVLPHKKAEYEEKYDTKNANGTIFRQSDRENSLIHLMRVNMLKRMESSINSFTITVQRLLDKNTMLYKNIKNHNLSSLEEMSIIDVDIDNEEYSNDLIGNNVKVLIQDIDKIKLMQDLENDIEKLNELLTASKVIDEKRDNKLQELKICITKKIENPLNNANKKVIIFTAFADTAEYLYSHISSWAKKEFGLDSCLITGSGNNKTTFKESSNDLNELLTHFSPNSKQRIKIYPEISGEIDILIATDCISEGQNLQDCDYLVNYDIHWNPVRIIQRFGRIDRLGSKNKQIQLVNFWANMELDEYINLESRVSGRMVLLDVSATGEENVIDSSNVAMNDLSYRTKQLKELQSQVLDLEDVSGSISITDLTLNDFRMDLSNYLKSNNDLKKCPKAIHSVVSHSQEYGKGVIFCIKLLDESKASTEDKYSLEPYYLVYISENQEINISPSTPKQTLDILKKLSIGNTVPNQKAYEILEQQTNNYENMQKYTTLLKSAIESIVGTKEEDDVASLFSVEETTFKSNGNVSFDDFELIAYLVLV